MRPGEIVFLVDVAANIDAARAFGRQALRHRDAASSVAAVDRVVAEQAGTGGG